jgi:RecT family
MANDVVPFKALTDEMANAYQVSPEEFVATVKTQCFPNGAASNAQLMMLLSFAKTYDLNPLAKECYAFISGGRMSVGVQVDGWTKIKTRRPDFDGQEFVEEFDKDGKLIATKSITYVKGRSHPTTYRAVLAEWKRDTDVWRTMPGHQLFVKAHNQGVRFAFGIPAYDPDDIERIAARTTETTATVVAEDKPKETKKLELVKDEPKQIETSAKVDPPPGESAETPATTATQRNPPPPATVAPGTPAESEPESETKEPKKLSPKAAREKLDKLISRHVPAARLNLMLGKIGKATVDALDDAEVLTLIAQIERKAK